MELAVVGCGIFKNEIEYLKPRITAALDFYWLPQRLHSKPLELRTLVQAEIDKADGADKTYDGIVLLYGLCSKGTIGVSSRKYPVAVPKVQDCIGILLGSNERYMAHFREKPGTYWFTKGWFETGFNPGKRPRTGRSGNGAASKKGTTAGTSRRSRPFDGEVLDFYKERYLEYRKKFGEEASRYLITEWDQRWIGNYTTLAFIDWGMKENRAFKKRAEESAGNLGLEFEDVLSDIATAVSRGWLA